MQNDLFFTGFETLLSEQGKVQYQGDFIDTALATHLFKDIQNTVTLRQEAISLFGKSVLQPRLTAWIADPEVEYEYSGLRSPAQTWTPLLLELKNRLEVALNHHFNGVLCNYYRNGQDYMGWHSDDEQSLGQQAVIASISLGAERRFDLRKKRQKMAESLSSVILQHGSLLVMSGQLQQYWQHRLPKQSHVDSPRINLTFRSIQLQ